MTNDTTDVEPEVTLLDGSRAVIGVYDMVVRLIAQGHTILVINGTSVQICPDVNDDIFECLDRQAPAVQAILTNCGCLRE